MHLIYLINEFHNLSWITEINELFIYILIYWNSPYKIYIASHSSPHHKTLGLLVVQYSCIGMFGEERTSWTTIDTLYITGTHKQGRVIWPFNFISTGQCKEWQKSGREEQGQENTLSIYCISVIRKLLGQPCTFRAWASTSSDSLNSTHTAMFLAWVT